MLERYFLLHGVKQVEPRAPTKEDSQEVIPPMTLSDDRRQITTLEENVKLSALVRVHNLSDYRRRISNEMLPNIDVAIDILTEGVSAR